MTAPCHHSDNSARLWGGSSDDYIEIHNWFDETKICYGDIRHRALRHHTFGINECVKKFGDYLINSDGTKVAVRYVAEQHVIEDCGGRIPSVQDWLENMTAKSWMARGTPTKLKHGTRQGANNV